METWDSTQLTTFVNFASLNDMQITANRREAKAIFALARGGDFDYSYEKMEKIEAFLTSTSTADDRSQHTDRVSVYAFVKLLGELRRRLRTGSTFSNPATLVRTYDDGEGQSGLISPARAARPGSSLPATPPSGAGGSRQVVGGVLGSVPPSAASQGGM